MVLLKNGALSKASLRNETSELDGEIERNSHRARWRGAPKLAFQLPKLLTHHQLCISLLLDLNKALNRAWKCGPHGG